MRSGKIGFKPDAVGAANELLQSMEAGLHELSQPMTALLCLLEFALCLEASDENETDIGRKYGRYRAPQSNGRCNAAEGSGRDAEENP